MKALITTVFSLVKLFLKARKYKMDLLLIVVDPSKEVYNISGIVSNPKLVISTLNNIVTEMCYKYNKISNSAEHWSHIDDTESN